MSRPQKTQRWQKAGFALYVHWPFCESKCPYCDFNSHVAGTINEEDWIAAYIKEMRRLATETSGRTLRSIYFGGGTPSLMQPATVQSIIDEANFQWRFANDIEITLEANPSSVEIGKFHDYQQAGINRISIGVQALRDSDLRRLGRMHSADEAKAAIAVAQAVFNRTSFDLIYARQDQTLIQWESELRYALSITRDHLSLYQLTVEPGTVFAARYDRGQLEGLPEEGLAADMFELTQAICEAEGRPAYEVSNHARPGTESRHNLVYWRGGDYVGIGPGAHGRLTMANGRRLATSCLKSPQDWLAAALQDGATEHPRDHLTAEEQATEFLMMGLRLTEGIDLELYDEIAGHQLDATKVAELEEMGLLAREPNRIRATAAGRLVLNSVIKHLLV